MNWRVATHESGHATAARALGLKVEGVGVRGGKGFCTTTYPVMLKSRQAELEAIVNSAGIAAEILFYGDHECGAGDNWTEEGTRKALDILRAHRAALDRMCLSLYWKHTLARADVERIT